MLASVILESLTGQAIAADAAASIDLQQNRADALSGSLRQAALASLTANELVWFGAPTVEGGGASPISSKLSVLGPFGYNDNVLSASQNAESAWHGTPEIKYEWQDKLADGLWTFYFAFDASADRYVDRPSADGDKSYSTMRLTYGKGDLAYKLLAYYSPTLTFSPTFHTRQSTSQDVAIGISKAFAYGADWYPDESLSQARKSLVFQLVGGRRLSDTRSSEFIKFTGEFDYQINFEWAAQFQALVQERVYDTQAGAGRSDFLVNPNITIAYAPGLATFGSLGGKDVRDALGQPEIDFQISYGKNSSSVTSKRFQQWNVGPVIRARWLLI